MPDEPHTVAVGVRDDDAEPGVDALRHAQEQDALRRAARAYVRWSRLRLLTWPQRITDNFVARVGYPVFALFCGTVIATPGVADTYPSQAVYAFAQAIILLCLGVLATGGALVVLASLLRTWDVEG